MNIGMEPREALRIGHQFRKPVFFFAWADRRYDQHSLGHFVDSDFRQSVTSVLRDQTGPRQLAQDDDPQQPEQESLPAQEVPTSSEVDSVNSDCPFLAFFALVKHLAPPAV
jgi:hypothetical protein